MFERRNVSHGSYFSPRFFSYAKQFKWETLATHSPCGLSVAAPSSPRNAFLSSLESPIDRFEESCKASTATHVCVFLSRFRKSTVWIRPGRRLIMVKSALTGYLKWVEQHPELATDLENGVKWVSYIATGKFYWLTNCRIKECFPY